MFDVLDWVPWLEKRIWAYAAIDLVLGAVPVILLALMLPDLTLVYFGLPIGGMLVVVFSFTAPFPSGLDQGNGDPSLTDLAHRLRMNGLMTEETPRSLTVHLDRWTAIDLRFQKRGECSRLNFRLDGTPSTLALFIFLFLSTVLGVLAIPICIYLMIEADRYARRFIIPVLSGGPCMVQGPQEEIKGLLVDGLSESRRLAQEGYRAANSAYEDNILIAIVAIGLIGWLVLLVILSQLPLFETSYRLVASALLALPISTAACTVTVFLIVKRVRPKVIALRQWTIRLDQALSRELTSQMPEGDESSIELLFSAYDEMPNWLSARRRDLSSRYPATSILLVLMALGGASLIFSSVFSLIGGDWALAMISIAMGAVLAGGALWLERWVMKWESAEETRLAQEWERRRKRLQRMIDLHLEGNDIG